MVGGLENGGISPDLRFRRATSSGKETHHVPFVLADANLAANIHGEGPGCAGPDDDFVAARFERSALNDLHTISHGHGRFADAAERNVRIGASRAFGKIDDDEELG